MQAFFESHPCDSMESFCMAKGDHLLVTQQNVGPELPCHDLWDGFLSSNLRKHMEKHITKKLWKKIDWVKVKKCNRHNLYVGILNL